MIFAVHVICGPYSSQSNFSALQFCKAALEQDQKIKRVFFSGDGVLAGTHLAVPPQDEIDLYKEWQNLSEENDVELVVCISACLRRGIINQEEAERYQRTNHNLPYAFILSGLGQLVEASIEADRLITFGD